MDWSSGGPYTCRYGPNFPDCHPITCQGRPIRQWESLLGLCAPPRLSTRPSPAPCDTLLTLRGLRHYGWCSHGGVRTLQQGLVVWRGRKATHRPGNNKPAWTPRRRCSRRNKKHLLAENLGTRALKLSACQWTYYFPFFIYIYIYVFYI